jgi:hypothetical protein
MDAQSVKSEVGSQTRGGQGRGPPNKEYESAFWRYRRHFGTGPPGETTLDPWLDDPFPDYDTEPDSGLSISAQGVEGRSHDLWREDAVP